MTTRNKTYCAPLMHITADLEAVAEMRSAIAAVVLNRNSKAAKAMLKAAAIVRVACENAITELECAQDELGTSNKFLRDSIDTLCLYLNEIERVGNNSASLMLDEAEDFGATDWFDECDTAVGRIEV